MGWRSVYPKAEPAQILRTKALCAHRRKSGRIVYQKRYHLNLAGTSTGLNSGNQPISPIESVVVGRREAALLRDLNSAGPAQDVAHVAGKARLVAVEVRDDGAVHVVEDVVLRQDLCAHAAVDARGGAVLEDRVEDVAGAEAQRGQAGADVDEAVVVVRDAQLARVLVCVAVGVADQAPLFPECQLIPNSPPPRGNRFPSLP